MTDLPIDPILPRLVAILGEHGRAVLQAPPGAGKTTLVPLAMLQAGLTDGRIVMLEPRRLATRAAALRMAESLGEDVGQTVGYRMRGDTRISAGDPDRGRHRRYPDPHDPIRCIARRHRCGDLR